MSNTACMGYIKLAGRTLGMADTEICKLLDEVYYQFDMKTVSEAEQAYRDIQLVRED